MKSSPADNAIDFYRIQCDQLGARVITLQEDLRKARRESQHNRTLALIIERVYALADQITDSESFANELGEQILMLLLERLRVDAAALLRRHPGKHGYQVAQGVGIPAGAWFSDDPKEFLGTAAWPGAAVLAAWGLELALWSQTSSSQWVLLLAFQKNGAATVSQSAQPANQAIAEAVVRIYDNLLLRHTTLAALTDSEANYRALFDGAQDAILLLDLGATVVLEANQKALDLLDGPPEEIRHQPLDRWPIPSDRPALKRVWKQAIRGLPQQAEARITTRSGRLLWTEIKLKRVDARQPVLLAVIRDITKRKVAEEDVRQLNERLELALEGGEIGLYNIDLETGAIVYDHRFVRVLGGNPDLTPKTLEEWLAAIHPEDLPRVRQVVSEARNRAPEKTELEYRIRHQSGNWIWLQDRGKGFDPDDSGRPRRAAGSFVDISARKTSEASIHHLAYYDPLTNLPNRRLFLERLTNAQSSALRSGHIGSVFFLDLDRFKRINDARGHDFGDQLLREVAERLLRVIRHEDTVARFGGDEFVLLIPRIAVHDNEAQHHAVVVAEKIRTALARPFVLAEGDVNSGASIGITLFKGQDSSAQEIIREADTALYRAKESGRNCIRFFETSMQLAAEARFTLEEELRQAIECEQLELHLQPQVDSNGRPIAAEALVRWRHPGKGLIPPNTFIPLAEETGLILAIGQWVLREAIRMLARSGATGLDFGLAVNVSPRQFHQAEFAAEVRCALQEAAVRPERLTLEITESIAIDDIDGTIKTMRELKTLGVQLSLDDFGTGYSSLTYLKRLPIDELKIDRAFVKDIPGDPDDAALVEAILAVSRHLGLRTVAEGVETAEQCEFLRSHGCDTYQGYFFGKPMPFDALLKTLDQWKPV